MNPFRYARAAKVDDAIGLIAQEPRGAFIGGGTSLVDLMKDGIETPDVLVDLNPVPLAEIQVQGNTARIGAMVRNTELAEHALIRERYPMLAEAVLSGASLQLRNAATVGGNLMQRTRCPYFRDKNSPCNKREPNSGCSAHEGYNRSHAILGGSEHCIAAHPSDMCVALSALEAVILVRSRTGERRITFEDFYVAPGDTPHVETTLHHDELIVAVELPELPFARTSRYIKVRDRASYEFALASAAVALDIQDGTIHAARVALGGVATKPWRASTAERILTGSKASAETFQKAAEAELEPAQPFRFNAFKIELAQRTLVRALTAVGGKA